MNIPNSTSTGNLQREPEICKNLTFIWHLHNINLLKIKIVATKVAAIYKPSFEAHSKKVKCNLQAIKTHFD